jgi:metal-responsive CopG/Arc/MetJ family transcriptional regulator
MKPLQITMDETLLKRLDADDEVKRDGRSAVIRRAIAEYLGRRRRRQVAESYQRGYASGVGEELAEWVGEGTWPDE